MKSEKNITIEIDRLCEKFEELAKLLAIKETYFDGFKKTIKHDFSSISFEGELYRKLETEIYHLEREQAAVHTQIKTLVWVIDRTK
ncbi:hypothetical protein QN089_05515 [Kurthia sp. YJT4]|uniref:hypothetical protein n=1 Tax=Kurthia sp. YJT4 TaxID=3049086 RepID=UPI00254D8DB1|nr:hypothetical protein [Kurthia sp. YJT4]WIL39726.1 hypothetical protein QN089_05515 [Kurthia sp. YJT4]